MTLSNFDWTDKDSVKWFILMPTGHEGPYSLNKLLDLKKQKKISESIKLWAEGLDQPVTLSEALSHLTEEEVPELPPLPEEEVPPLPSEEEVAPENYVLSQKRNLLPFWAFLGAGILIMLFFALDGLGERFQTISIRRYPKMSLNLYERVLKENAFESWDKKIFFKEYLPDDHSHIWLVTASFQACEVEAHFRSLPEKLLSHSDEEVSFKSKGKLSGHVTELSSFEFEKGVKIVPGLYEMDIKASQCEWDTVMSKVMNMFTPPEKEYVARTKVVLFSKGAVEFNTVLDRLLKKKREDELKEQSQNELFWMDLQQKLETLHAVALQVEQLFLDLLDENPKDYSALLKKMIQEYTKKYGSFLTTFVIENENYFKALTPAAQGISQKRNYEMMVKLTSKKIGFESMKIIEELQANKKLPTKKELDAKALRVKKTYAQIKSEINQKIIQLSDDRSE